MAKYIYPFIFTICTLSSLTTGNHSSEAMASPTLIERQIDEMVRIKEKSVEPQARCLLDEIEKLLSKVDDSPGCTALEHSKIRLQIVLGQANDATIGILRILSKAGEDVSEMADILNKTLSLCAELRQAGWPFRAEQCEKRAVDVFKRGEPSPERAYMILKWAYLRGQTDFVLDTIFRTQLNLGSDKGAWRFSWLNAKTCAAQYRKARLMPRYGWLNKPGAEKLRGLARTCTTAYEKAVNVAPSKFVAMQIANEWWGLICDRRYDADSALLRKAAVPASLQKPHSPLAQSRRVNDAEAALIAELLKTFREAVLTGLKQGPLTRKLDQEQQKSIADECSRILKSFGVADIPEDIMAQVIRDVPSYWKYSFPRPISNSQTLTNTFSWYLWGAIVRPVPDRYERKLIDRQMEEYARMIERNFKEAITLHPKFNIPASSDAERLRNSYQKLKNNCFIPYFKVAMLPFEQRWTQVRLAKSWAKIKQSLVLRAKGYDKKRDSVWPDQHWTDYEQVQKIMVMAPLFLCITYYDRPGTRIHLPSWWVHYNSSTLTADWIYAFTVEGARTAPGYEWKKRLTQEEGKSR